MLHECIEQTDDRQTTLCRICSNRRNSPYEGKVI